jgi:type IV pilus assembly protein PilC
MPRFTYRAKDLDGRNLDGWLEAENEEALIQMLHQQGKVILSIGPHERRGQSTGGELALRLIEPKVRSQDLVQFAWQLSAMVDAGIPLLRCMSVIIDETENLRLKRILMDVNQKLEAGSSFSRALEEQGVFSNLFVSLVRAGEMTGQLNETLMQMAEYMENEDTLRRKVRNVLTYPVFLIGFSMMVMMILVLWMIPAFSRVYDKFKATIPGPTLLVMNISQTLRDNILILVLLCVGLGLGAWLLLRTERARYLRDLFLMKVPIMGPIFVRSALSRFSRTLGVLVGSGIPFLEALELTTLATDNRVLRRALNQASGAIQRGNPIALALDETGVFPRMIVSMIASGEETGSLPPMLMKSAGHYEQQVDRGVSNFMALLGPLLIIFLGGMIGGILLAMYLPVFTLGRVMH